MTPASFCRALCIALALALSVHTANASASPREVRVFTASGVAAGKVPAYLTRLDHLADELAPRLASADDEARAAAIHAFLHERILRGRYEPSASDLGVAMDGGAFNCVSATVLYTMLAERCGVTATAMSVPGHVWCRVAGVPEIDIESTRAEWFAIRAKYRGIPTSQVSPAMAKHRRRQVVGRPLDEPKLLAVLHYNRGVTLIQEGQLQAAAWQNLRAVALDPACQPARENLEAVASQASAGQFSEKNTPSTLTDALILWSLEKSLEKGARTLF